jgi:cytochrome b subunit of formate dehydrogenase
MSGIELFFLMFVLYILPIIFLSPYCKHKIINFIPIVNFVWMILLFIQEVEIWLFTRNNDDEDNLKGNV